VTDARGTLSSGQMVRRSGLSMKALRLYDDRGLLVPASVDPRSGYRAYAPEQVDRARQIALLRRLEMPLVRVAEVLDADRDRARDHLLAWWVERREVLETQRRAALELARSLGVAAHPDRPDHAALEAVVRRREVPERTVATITSEVSQAGLVPTFTADALLIRKHLAAGDARAGAGHEVIYHQVPLGGVPARIETCVPYEGVATPVGDIVLRAEPARVEAYLEVPVRDCGFPEIVGYHEAVLAVTGSTPLREIYRGAWSEDPAEIVAEVAAAHHG
jgi:DNA-binding transcriptional MerR regulator